MKEKDIYNSPLTVVSSEPLNGKMELIYQIINTCGIKDKKSIHIFNFDGNNNWFTINLIASISKIDKNKVEAYFEPWGVIGKLYQESIKNRIDRDKFMDTIELLQKNDIVMTDFDKQIIEKDYLDYCLNYYIDLDTKIKDIYIINTLDMLFKKTRYPKDVVLEKINEFAKKNHINIILITNAKYKNKDKLELEDIIEYDLLNRYDILYYLTRKINNKIEILAKEGK